MKTATTSEIQLLELLLQNLLNASYHMRKAAKMGEYEYKAFTLMPWWLAWPSKWWHRSKGKKLLRQIKDDLAKLKAGDEDLARNALADLGGDSSTSSDRLDLLDGLSVASLPVLNTIVDINMQSSAETLALTLDAVADHISQELLSRRLYVEAQ